MAVNVSNRVAADATESLQGYTASAPTISIAHSFAESQGAASYENVYSRSFNAALNDLITEVGTLLDLSALTYPNRTGTLDMVTTQRVALLLVKNNGPTAATLTLENATVPIANGTFKIPVGMALTIQSETNQLLSEQILNIRLVTDINPSGTEMEILFASKSTA